MSEQTWWDIEKNLTGPLTPEQIEKLIPELVSRGADVRRVVQNDDARAPGAA